MLTLPELSPPEHPGKVLKRDLQIFNISIKELSDCIFVSRQYIHRVISGKARITPDLALKLSTFFRNRGPRSWMILQGDYDLYIREQELKDQLDIIVPLITNFDYFKVRKGEQNE